MKIAIPFAKSKYILMIDSELVVWTKDEKVCKNIVSEIIAEIFNLQAISAWSDSVPFA